MAIGPRLAARPCDALTPSPDTPTVCGSALGGAIPRSPFSVRPRARHRHDVVSPTHSMNCGLRATPRCSHPPSPLPNRRCFSTTASRCTNDSTSYAMASTALRPATSTRRRFDAGAPAISLLSFTSMGWRSMAFGDSIFKGCLMPDRQPLGPDSGKSIAQ